MFLTESQFEVVVDFQRTLPGYAMLKPAGRTDHEISIGIGDSREVGLLKGAHVAPITSVISIDKVHAARIIPNPQLPSSKREVEYLISPRGWA